MHYRRLLVLAAPLAGAGLLAAALATASSGAAAGPMDPPSVRLWVNQSQSQVSAEAAPGTTVTLTLWRAGVPVDEQVGVAGSGGGFALHLGNEGGIRPGDVVGMRSSVGITATVDVIPITGEANASTNKIQGHVNAPVCPASVRGEVWVSGGPNVVTYTNASCDYNIDFSPFDVRMGDMIALWYVRPDDHRVGILRSPLRARVDLDDDRVYGNASPDAPVQVTVTSGLSQVVASTIVNENGDYNVPLYSMDIEFDDTVTVTAGLSRVVLHTPMNLTAQMDAAADTISGYGPPNTTLHGSVYDSWVGDFTTTTDGTGHYSFNTNQPPFNYDLQPENMGEIGVEDAEHEVAYVHFGAVDLWLGMNGAGGAQAAPGGRYSYELRYRANRVPARDVVITDTLPSGVSYIGNNRGYTSSVVGGQVVISVPMIHADQEQSLQLTVEFSSSLHANDPIHNEAIIGSGQPESNPGDNSAFYDMTLVSNDTDVTVWKDPRTGDPAPGQQMIYQIGYHNNGSTGSSEVRITDTLPISTTFVRWWSDEVGWTLVQSDTQVVWRRDTIQGNQGSSLYLVVQLDGGLGIDQQLHNHVDIFAVNDTNSGNNSADRDVNTGLPRRNLTIGKSFNAGSTTAGGEIRYGLHYNNNGNMAAHGVLLTDTLPLGTTYVDSGYGTSDGWVSVPYSSHVGNDYVWGPATFIPGAFGNFEVVVRVGWSVPAGTILTNTARITSSDGDDWPYDDSASVVETVFAAGPNLHVYKEQRWNGTGQLEYTVHVENRGNSPVNNIWVTDTYPLSTSFSGNWWIPWTAGNTQVTATLSNPQRAVFWISYLDGGGTAGIQFQLNLDGGIVNQPGLIFTNTLVATIPPGDTNISDNTSTAVAFTGPDLYVNSRVVGGVPGPGQVITYELEYGNRSDMWDASGNTTWLVHTLPIGMKYVSAQHAPDLVVGNTLIWLEGRLWRNWMDVIQVTAQITSSAKMGDSFTSLTSIYDRNTPSIEPFYGNNTSRMVVALAPKAWCYVPILRR